MLAVKVPFNVKLLEVTGVEMITERPGETEMLDAALVGNLFAVIHVILSCDVSQVAGMLQSPSAAALKLSEVSEPSYTVKD